MTNQSSGVYEPKGMVFWSKGKSIMLVSDEEPRESLRGWLLYRHPDGQWVTLRKATNSDLQAVYGSGRVEDGRVIVDLRLRSTKCLDT